MIIKPPNLDIFLRVKLLFSVSPQSARRIVCGICLLVKERDVADKIDQFQEILSFDSSVLPVQYLDDILSREHVQRGGWISKQPQVTE